MDAALLFLAFSGTYILFMFFAYRLAKAFFPRVTINDEAFELMKARRAKRVRNIE
jgi:hypothetical protein